MEAFSALLALCAGNSPVTGEFPSQRPVTRSFDAFFDLRLNKWLNQQSRGWWFETPSPSLWRHCNVTTGFLVLVAEVIFYVVHSHSLHTALERKYTQPCTLFSRGTAVWTMGAQLCEQWGTAVCKCPAVWRVTRDSWEVPLHQPVSSCWLQMSWCQQEGHVIGNHYSYADSNLITDYHSGTFMISRNIQVALL